MIQEEKQKRIWTAKQNEKYKRVGAEYEVLFQNLLSANPTAKAAQDALVQRLHLDIGILVNAEYAKKFDALDSSMQYSYEEDAEDAINEYALTIAGGVLAGLYPTGASILGYRRFLRPMARRRINEEIEKSKCSQPLYLRHDDENPAVAAAMAPVVRLLPYERLESLTTLERDTLAALEAYGCDHEAAAAYFGISVGTLNTRIQRIRKKMDSPSRKGNGSS